PYQQIKIIYFWFHVKGGCTRTAPFSVLQFYSVTGFLIVFGSRTGAAETLPTFFLALFCFPPSRCIFTNAISATTEIAIHNRSKNRISVSPAAKVFQIQLPPYRPFTTGIQKPNSAPNRSVSLLFSRRFHRKI